VGSFFRKIKGLPSFYDILYKQTSKSLLIINLGVRGV